MTLFPHFMHNLWEYFFGKRRGIGLPVFSECVLALHT